MPGRCPAVSWMSWSVLECFGDGQRMGRSKQTQRQLWSPQAAWGRGARRWASLIGWAVCGVLLWEAAGREVGAAWAQGVSEASGTQAEVVRAGSPGMGAGAAAYRLRAGRFLAGRAVSGAVSGPDAGAEAGGAAE